MEVLYRQAESKTPAHFGRDFSLFRLTLDQTAAAFFFLRLPSKTQSDEAAGEERQRGGQRNGWRI